MSRSDINKAFDIIAARVDAGIASPGDRACYYVLGTSAFRQVPGKYSSRDCEVVEAIQESLAYTVIASERIGMACPDCGEPYRLTTVCEPCEARIDKELEEEGK